MKALEIDWLDQAAGSVRVQWMQGSQPLQTRTFPTRAQGEAFALKKMGARGMMLSLLDMTPQQRAEHEARKRRRATITKELGL